MTADASAQAFLLLTLPNATLLVANATHKGTLALECVTVVVPPSYTSDASSGAIVSPVNRDVYLVLRLNSFERPLDPARVVELSSSVAGEKTYTFQGTETDPTVLVLSVKMNEKDVTSAEDLETFETIIAQYADFRGTLSSQPPSLAKASAGASDHPQDLRGHLVLINEDSGEVIGQVDTDRKFKIEEDARLGEKGRENEPVVVEIPDRHEGAGSATEEDPLHIYVGMIPPGEENWMTKGATVVR
jgi:spartin